MTISGGGFSQQITMNILRFNATCDWPSTTAAATYTVCGAVKLDTVYLAESAAHWQHFTQLNISIYMMCIE